MLVILMSYSRVLFWRDSPKVKMIFGLLVGTLFTLVTVPAGLFAMAYCQGKESFSWASFWPFPVGICLFVLAMSWGYVAHVLRRAFHCSRRTAGVMAVVFASPPGVAVVLLACALKTRNRAALCALAILALAATLLARVICMAPFAWQTYVLQALSLVVVIAYVATIVVSPPERRAYKWAIAPVLVYTLGVAFMTLAAAWLDNRANRLDAELTNRTGVSWTLKDATDFCTNGISMTNGPYAMLYTNDVPFPDWRAIKLFKVHERFTQEDVDRYTKFVDANAEAIALLDELTDLAVYRPALDEPPGIECFFNGIFPYRLIHWARFYQWKINVAAYQGDVPMVMDCLRRLRNMYGWMDASPLPFGQMMASVVDSIRRGGVARALPQLHTDVLRELQAEIASQLAGTPQRRRMMLMHRRVIMRKVQEEFERRVLDNSRMLRAVPGLPQTLTLWQNHERLTLLGHLQHILVAMNQDEDEFDLALQFMQSEDNISNFFVRCLGEGDENWYDAMNITIRNDDCRRAALAGIAVERYRRERHALPESLDALVPEFLDRIPSVASRKRLQYQVKEFEQIVNTTTNSVNGFEISVGATNSSRRVDFTVLLE